MTKKIKIGAVNYLNTKPLLYGLENSAIINEIELYLDYPSILATKLKENSLDIALLPVAAIPEIPNASIISNYGIASDGNVTSVAIFSNVPVDEIECVYLDYQSRTSVALVKILFKHYWKIEPVFLEANKDYIQNIVNRTSGVIIGDRALSQLNKFEFVYDLSKAWKNMTGLDFIFAAWVSNKNIESKFIEKFNDANALGIKHINDVITQINFSDYDLNTYYSANIKFKFDKRKIDGLKLFLEMLKKY